MTNKGWQREFENPIPLPDGRMLTTLLEVGKYITTLAKADQRSDEWQAAVEALLLVVKQNGPTMFARIGFMQALNGGRVREFNSDRKDTHWGRRKLKRDE
jgi:hypothetical protein